MLLGKFDEARLDCRQGLLQYQEQTLDLLIRTETACKQSDQNSQAPEVPPGAMTRFNPADTSDLMQLLFTINKAEREWKQSASEDESAAGEVDGVGSSGAAQSGPEGEISPVAGAGRLLQQVDVCPVSGRRLVAAADLDPGTDILVERPLGLVVQKHCRKTRCCGCSRLLQPLYSALPCRRCPIVSCVVP